LGAVNTIKMMACAVCSLPGPSEAHEIEQGRWFTSIPLCVSCHRDNFNGIHGNGRIWKALKKTELSCLNDTVRELVA
jgi:hypothetical protein